MFTLQCVTGSFLTLGNIRLALSHTTRRYFTSDEVEWYPNAHDLTGKRHEFAHWVTVDCCIRTSTHGFYKIST